MLGLLSPRYTSLKFCIITLIYLSFVSLICICIYSNTAVSVYSNTAETKFEVDVNVDGTPPDSMTFLPSKQDPKTNDVLSTSLKEEFAEQSKLSSFLSNVVETHSATPGELLHPDNKAAAATDDVRKLTNQVSSILFITGANIKILNLGFASKRSNKYSNNLYSEPCGALRCTKLFQRLWTPGNFEFTDSYPVLSSHSVSEDRRSG